MTPKFSIFKKCYNSHFIMDSDHYPGFARIQPYLIFNQSHLEFNAHKRALNLPENCIVQCSSKLSSRFGSKGKSSLKYGNKKLGPSSKPESASCSWRCCPALTGKITRRSSRQRISFSG